jgi:hypothetical protein
LRDAGEVDLVDVETARRLPAVVAEGADAAAIADAGAMTSRLARLLRAQRRRLQRLGRQPAVARDAARPPGAGANALLTFATPLWLAGLRARAGDPLAASRRRAHRREVPVSRVELFRDAQASRTSAAERRPPDPAWRRRALLAGAALDRARRAAASRSAGHA